jgi:hypothetical protein
MRTARVALASIACAVLLGAGSSAEARQISQFHWNFARAAATVEAKQMWTVNDLDLFLEHVRHRALNYLTPVEWSNAYHNGAESPGETDLGTFYGNKGVAWAAFEKWARKYELQLACPVFQMCYATG